MITYGARVKVELSPQGARELYCLKVGGAKKLLPN